MVFGYLNLIQSCNSSTEPIPAPTTIEELFKQSGELPSVPTGVLSKEDIGTKDEVLEEGEDKFVSKSQYKRVKNSLQSIASLTPSYGDYLYPGSVVQGKDIRRGVISPVSVAMNPITLSLLGASTSSETVLNPNIGSATTARTKLIKNAPPQPANMQYSLSEMYSTEQSMLEVGLDASWLVGSISADMQTLKSKKTHSILLYFKQVFYSVASSRPSFDSTVKLAELTKFISNGNPACYISNVDYGRVILVKITADTSFDALTTAVGGRNGIASGSSTFKKSNFKFNHSVKAYIIGGDPSLAGKAITGDIDKINDLIAQGAKVSESNPGIPISYSLRYLYDDKAVPLGSQAEYTIPDWKLDPESIFSFDLYLDKINIIDDGNGFVDGKFYYRITLLDKNNNPLKDANGDVCLIETSRDEYQKKSDGESISLLKQFRSVIVRKKDGEKFTLKVELYDRFESGNDVVAGEYFTTWTYPFSAFGNGYQSWTLRPSSGSSYKSSIVWKLVTN